MVQVQRRQDQINAQRSLAILEKEQANHQGVMGKSLQGGQMKNRDELVVDILNIICNGISCGPEDGYCERLADFILARERKMVQKILELLEKSDGSLASDQLAIEEAVSTCKECLDEE
jgi:hypothetical protein